MSKKKQKEPEKPPILSPEPPSDDFMTAVAENFGGSALEKECGFCGITHFATWNEEEYGEWSDDNEDDGDTPSYLIHLREMAEEKPDWYIEHGNMDAIPWGNLNGKEIVLGCPCNAGLRYEQFIKSHDKMISEYLSAVSQKELEKATKDARIAENIRDSNLDLERKISEAEEQRKELEEREEELTHRVKFDQKNLKLKKENLARTLSEERSRLNWEKERIVELDILIEETKKEREEFLAREAEKALSLYSQGRMLDI